MLDESVIPKGPYCYTPIRTPEVQEDWEKRGIFRICACPYWERYDQKIHGPLPAEYAEFQSTYRGAYCKFLKTGDWEHDGTMLLWDQVKECGINDDWEDEES